MKKISDRYFTFLLCLTLTLAAFFAFQKVLQYDFVDYDDYRYVVNNPHVNTGFSYGSVIWAFTSSHASNWHPLTWISHMLDCELFGLDPFGHHLVNLFFHIANSLLLFWILKRMTQMLWPSFFVAAAFALHPLHVESVAWIAERKDVLSALFWILTIAAYIRYTERSNISRYLLVVLFFALGLMAKPMLVTLPFVLLLLDYWPLQRLKIKTVLEKIPLFILSAVSCIITFVVQQGAGVIGSTEGALWGLRIENSIVSYAAYIVKMIYPAKLAVMYPFPINGIPDWKPIVSFVVLLGLSVAVLCMAKRRKYLITGWLWYLGTLVPVIGLVQVGLQSSADRYTYLPSIGIFIMIAFGSAELFAKWRYRKIVFRITAALLLIAIFICTRLQVRHWKNSFTLFERALAVNKNNFVIHNYYADILLEKNRLSDAAAHINETLRINPRHKGAVDKLGRVCLQQGRIDEAIGCFNDVLSARPNWYKTHHNIGIAYGQKGKFDLALQHLNRSLDLKPDNPEAICNLGILLYRQGKTDQAIDKWEKTLKLSPVFSDAHFNLAIVTAGKGDFSQAVKHFNELVEISPKQLYALEARANTFISKSIKVRNSANAVAFALRACELTNYRSPNLLDVLAFSYAVAGRFPEAIAVAENAINLAKLAGNEKLTRQILARRKLYQKKQY